MPLTPTYTTDASPPYTLSQANRLLNDMAQRHGDLVHVAHQVLAVATTANEELALMLARLAAVLHVPVPDVATGSEIDALMADIGEHGEVTIRTVTGGFLVSFVSTDESSRGTSREASVVEALRVIHEELEARNQ